MGPSEVVNHVGSQVQAVKLPAKGLRPHEAWIRWGKPTLGIIREIGLRDNGGGCDSVRDAEGLAADLLVGRDAVLPIVQLALPEEEGELGTARVILSRTMYALVTIDDLPSDCLALGALHERFAVWQCGSYCVASGASALGRASDGFGGLPPGFERIGSVGSEDLCGV